MMLKILKRFWIRVFRQTSTYLQNTDSFFYLDSDVTKCQSYESNGTYDSCTTRYYSEKMQSNCGCLPYAIRNATIIKEKVSVLSTCIDPNLIFYYARYPLVLQKRSLLALR